MSKYIIPLLLLFLFIFAITKKAPVYDYFVEGAKGAIPLSVTIFPYITAMLIVVELMINSGIANHIEVFLAPLFSLFGIPSGLFQLVLFRPFTGSGAYAILENIFTTFGVDSYEGRCASVIAGSSETIFYLASIYFSSQGIKKFGTALVISTISTFIGIIVACFLCRF